MSIDLAEDMGRADFGVSRKFDSAAKWSRGRLVEGKCSQRDQRRAAGGMLDGAA